MAEEILIVEDDDSGRELLSWTLEDAGYRTVCAAHGLEALDLLGDHEVSLVLMDVNMPWMNGWQLLDAIRKEPARARLPVVVLGGGDRPPPGADAFLRKPCDIDALLACVRARLRA